MAINYAPQYQLSPAGEHFIMTDEHLELVVYNNGDGHPTAGWGHTGAWPDGSPLVVGQQVTRDQAVAWFRVDVRAVLAALSKKSTDTGVLLYQWQVDALTSLLFNCGVGLLEHEHSLGLAFERGDTDAIGKSILLYRMATIDGIRGPYLQARREAEFEMFTQGNTYATAAVRGADNRVTPNIRPDTGEATGDDVCVAIPPTPGLDQLT